MKLQDIDKTEKWGSSSTLPPGRHLCVIDSAEESVTSNGNPQIILELRAVAGPDRDSTIRDWQVVVPSTYGRVRQILEAAQIDIQGGEWDLDPQALVGRRVAILVKMETKEQGKHAGKEFPTVWAYDTPKDSDAQASSDVPADTSGFASNGDAAEEEPLPF